MVFFSFCYSPEASGLWKHHISAIGETIWIEKIGSWETVTWTLDEKVKNLHEANALEAGHGRKEKN